MARTTGSELEWYTTSQVAAASSYSVQQIRDLERLGVIPSSARQSNGYRRFTRIHVTALRAYRDLAISVGPVAARATMQDIRRLPHDEAVARIVVLHVGLARQREDALAALRALDSIVDESADEPPVVPGDSMSITELSAALGVRASTLRFWEAEGLVAPERGGSQSVRCYPPGAVRDARVVAALRAGGYRIPAIHGVMVSLRDLDSATDAREALRSQLSNIAARSVALLRAGADLAELLESPAPGNAMSHCG
ncbi:MerR family transcriptional regulator [Agromyces laixinhei]|uniref:MerR family transcriptional regulator n=1 Tax=Agromyces laixinhei TaxID=2585717 RepID=UPI00111777AF|nr:MerR family transcriptional regulator [Agromyces laixinhei]